MQVREIDVERFATERREDVAVLDVRSVEEFAAGHVPGAVNVPLEQVTADPGRFAPEAVRDLPVRGSQPEGRGSAGRRRRVGGVGGRGHQGMDLLGPPDRYRPVTAGRHR